MRIEVTQDDIDKGKRGDPCYCPVALAISRVVNVPRGSVLVDPTGADVGDDVYKLPPEVWRFITRYDLRLKVEPFTFDLASA